MARNLCLFAHFDAFNRVEPYVLRYVEAIHSCDFEVVFISTAMIPDTDCAALLRFCREVIRRPNTGLDFASWATGYAKYGHNFEGELLLANDSVYGPIGKLDDALSRLRALPGDVRGMVESLERGQHLQSWFLLLSRKAHQSSSFRDVLAKDFTKLSKAEIILKGEIDLSSRLRASGLSSAALFSLADRAYEGAIVRYNPTHMLWKELVEVVGIPFIKVELLRDNPHSISDVMAWRSVVHARSPELIPMIERHLSRDRQDWIHNSRVICFSRLITKESFMRRDFRLDRLGKLIKKRLNRRAFEIAMKSYRSMRDGFGLRSTDKTVGEHR